MKLIHLVLGFDDYCTKEIAYMKRLTVIIVFLNEGAEVYNTVASIRENSSIDEVDIMLINDASDDGTKRAILSKSRQKGRNH